MADNQFDQIDYSIFIRKNEDNPKHHGILFCVKELISRVNRNLTKLFSAGWISCVDEYNIVSYNKYSTVSVYVNRKPHPLGK